MILNDLSEARLFCQILQRSIESTMLKLCGVNRAENKGFGVKYDVEWDLENHEDCGEPTKTNSRSRIALDP